MKLRELNTGDNFRAVDDRRAVLVVDWRSSGATFCLFRDMKGRGIWLNDEREVEKEPTVSQPDLFKVES